MNLANIMDAKPSAGVDGQRAALAAELAAAIIPVPDIAKRYNLTIPELKQLMTDPQFRHQVAEFKREWNSPLTAKERTRVKAALAVEDGLIEIYRIFHDPDIPPPVRLEAYRELVKLGDMAPKKEAEGPVGGGFSITINVPRAGDDTQAITLEGTAEGGDE